MFKTRFLSMLVLLMTVVTGAVAQTTYKVSVKEGTEDATSWTIAPAEATTTGVAAGTTVTATYSGTKKVKSVKVKRKTTTGNITVYFTDAQDYGDVHIYYWNDGPDWPGTPMTYVKNNEYSQKIYKAEIPAAAEGIIFNGNGSQTVDITENIADGSWWYATDQLDGWKNEVGYVGKYTENIEVTNVDDNKWTFTMPDFNVELDIEYNVTYPVTISDGDVDAAKWSATPTEQSVGQTVTLSYSGKKKVKNITIEAAPTAPATVTYTELNGGEVLHVGDIINLSEEIYVNDGYYMGSYGSPYTVVRADLTIDKYEEIVVNEKADGNYYVIKANDGYYYDFQRALGVTSTSDGILVTYNGKSGSYKSYTFTVHEP